MKLKQILLELFLSDKVFYHGTNKKFNKFEYTTNSGTHGDYHGKGIYVTDNIEYAKEFGTNILKCKLTVKNPFELIKASDGLFDKFMSFITDKHDKEKIESCLRMKAITTAYRIIRKYVTTEDMEKLGYDCVVTHADHLDGGIEVIVFDPNDVKIIK